VTCRLGQQRIQLGCFDPRVRPRDHLRREREFFIDNLLVRIHFIIVMVWWTSLAPWEFEFPFPGSLSTFLSYAWFMFHGAWFMVQGAGYGV